MKRFSLVLLALLCLSCEKAVVEYFTDRIIENNGRISSYSGTVSEKGLLPGDAAVRTEICFEKSGKFSSKVVSPAELAGNAVRFDGTALSLHYPSSRFGIVFTGLGSLIPDTQAKRAARLRDYLAARSRENTIIWRGNDIIAGRRAYHFTAEPRVKGAASHYEHFWGDGEFSFPLKATLLGDGKARFYSFEFEKIEFNSGGGCGRFDHAVPPGTMTARWDFTDADHSAARMRASLNFRLYLPRTLPPAMKPVRLIRARGIIPAACAAYYDGTRYVLITEVKDYGLVRIRPWGIGLPEVSPGARLLFFGESSIISWKRGDVLLTMVGNLPWQVLADIAKGME